MNTIIIADTIGLKGNIPLGPDDVKERDSVIAKLRETRVRLGHVCAICGVFFFEDEGHDDRICNRCLGDEINAQEVFL